MVDAEHQLVVAAGVAAEPNDEARLMPLLDEVEEDFGAKPAEVLADAGYCSEANMAALKSRKTAGYVALGREGKRATGVDPVLRPATHRMKQKLATEIDRTRYARRKLLSEAPHGWIKEALGFRRFSFRGLAKVQGEWDLVCLALNMKRIGTLASVS